MIQDTLPYLIDLLSRSVFLHMLVASGSWHGINLAGYDHEVMGKTLIIKNFPLGKSDTFEITFSKKPDIEGKKNDSITTLILTTRDSKYFENSSYYFNDDENRGMNRHPVVKEMRKYKKDLGVFKIYGNPVRPAFVRIVSNPIYGYGIFILFYTNFDETYRRRKSVEDAFEAQSDSFHIR